MGGWYELCLFKHNPDYSNMSGGDTKARLLTNKRGRAALLVCWQYVTWDALCVSASTLRIVYSTSADFNICVDGLNLIPSASTKSNKQVSRFHIGTDKVNMRIYIVFNVNCLELMSARNNFFNAFLYPHKVNKRHDVCFVCVSIFTSSLGSRLLKPLHLQSSDMEANLCRAGGGLCLSLTFLSCVHKHGCVCVCMSFLQGKAEMNVRLSVMTLLNLWNTGVLELQGLPYAA